MHHQEEQFHEAKLPAPMIHICVSAHEMFWHVNPDNTNVGPSVRYPTA